MAQLQQLDLTNFFQCDQIWEEMPVCEKGRVCEECNKTLIDFRNLSDDEMSDIHSHSPETICGIYKREQIRIIDKLNVPTSASNWKVIGIGLAGILFSQNVSSQHLTAPIQLSQLTNQTKTIDQQISNSSNDKLIIHGKVTSTENEELIGANVYIKNFDLGTTTDFEGNYSLDITEVFDSLSQVIIIYNYIGFENKELVFSRNNDPELNIVMPDAVLNLDELVVTGFFVSLTTTPSFWQRVSSKVLHLFNGKMK